MPSIVFKPFLQWYHCMVYLGSKGLEDAIFGINNQYYTICSVSLNNELYSTGHIMCMHMVTQGITEIMLILISHRSL